MCLSMLRCGIAVLALSASIAQAEPAWNGVRTGNPIIPGYFSRPQCWKTNGVFFIRAASEGLGSNMLPDCLWSSTDFVNWSCQIVTGDMTRAPVPPASLCSGKKMPLVPGDDGTIASPEHWATLEEGGRTIVIYQRLVNPQSIDCGLHQICADMLVRDAAAGTECVKVSHAGIGHLAPSTKRDTNLSLGRQSTSTISMSLDTLPQNGIDGNLGTLWKAGCSDGAQWFFANLEGSCVVRRVETMFEYPQFAYKYIIEYASSLEQWHIFANRSNNTERGIVVDTGVATAKFMRITIFGNDSGMPEIKPALWEFSAFDGIDKSNQPPTISGTSCLTGTIRFATLALNATVHDDGLTEGPVRVAWTKASGPGSVSFAHSDRTVTEATFGSTGYYTLVIEADDGAAKATGIFECIILPATNVIALYSFDDRGTLLVRDGSPNGRDAYLRNGGKRCLGLKGFATQFDGIDDRLDVPALGVLSNFSFDAWINLHALPTGQMAVVAANGSISTPAITIDSSGRIQVVAASRVLAVSLPLFTRGTLGTWRHVAVVCDSTMAGSITIYVDGARDCTRTNVPPLRWNMSHGVSLAGAESLHEHLDGELDELRIVDGAVGAADIAQRAARPPMPTIADAKASIDNPMLVILGMPVVYAPRDPVSGLRTTDYFYVAERTSGAGIRVNDGASGIDNVREGMCASFMGVVLDMPSGERCIEVVMMTPDVGGPAFIAPRQASVRGASEGEDIVGSLVETKGDIVVRDGCIVLADKAGGAEIRMVVPPCMAMPKEVNNAKITGVVSIEGEAGAACRVLLVKHIELPKP